MTAKINTYDVVGMMAEARCDRCDGQAYVEVALNAGGKVLFCAHHGTKHWSKIIMLDATISDHRPFLANQEKVPVSQ